MHEGRRPEAHPVGPSRAVADEVVPELSLGEFRGHVDLAQQPGLGSDVADRGRVFAGAQRWLASVDYLICEYWPYGMHRMGDSQEAFIEFAGRFAFGAQLSGNCPPARLEPVDAVMARVRSLFPDASNPLYVDLLLSQHPDFPG